MHTGADRAAQPQPPIPLLAVSAGSGTGKTTLLTRVIPRLRAAGVRVGVIKHAHHDFDIDQPGKDSHRLRRSGADWLLVASSARRALLVETPQTAEPGGTPDLMELLAHIDPAQVDLVLAEGFKQSPVPKLEVYRRAVAKPPLYPHDSWVIALVGDAPPPQATALPVLDIDDIDAVTAFILAWWQAQRTGVLPHGSQT